jgi:ribosomal protein L11 methyltransferase
MPIWELRVAAEPGAIVALEAALGGQTHPGWSIWDDRLSGRVWLNGYFESRAAAKAAWKQMRAAWKGAAGTRGTPALRRLADTEWRVSYKRHFKPGRCGRLHWAPEWERKTYRVPSGDSVVWLEPGLAFGTGNHETTRLAIGRLVAFAKDRTRAGTRCRSVIDVGCGSGILSISAVRLGLGPVVGFDCDPEAVAVSSGNAKLNGLTSGLGFSLADIRGGLSGRTADLVLANIDSDVLQRHAAELMAAVARGGWLALSGILSVELAQVRATFARISPDLLIDSRALGEWSDLRIVRPD